MKYVTLERLRNAMESRYYHEHPNQLCCKKLYTAFKKKFGDKAPIKEFVVWFVENRKEHGEKVGHLLSTKDGQLTRACIENGMDPHTDKGGALLLAAEDGDGGSVASLEVLLDYKPSLQAMKNALKFMFGFSMGSNPKTEALLKRHIAEAESETEKKRQKRAAPVPEGHIIWGGHKF